MIEIVIITIISIIYAILLTFVLKAYYNDTESMEIRILQLEKRIEDFKKDYKGIYIPINDEMSLLIPLCEKDNFDMEKVNYYFSNYGKPSVKVKENNTQESGDDKMPCGRKGRPKGSKNIGGRRK